MKKCKNCYFFEDLCFSGKGDCLYVLVLPNSRKAMKFYSFFVHENEGVNCSTFKPKNIRTRIDLILLKLKTNIKVFINWSQ